MLITVILTCFLFIIIAILSILLGKVCTKRDKLEDELNSLNRVCKNLCVDLVKFKTESNMWKRSMDKVGEKDANLKERNRELETENSELKKRLEELNKFDRSDVLDLG